MRWCGNGVVVATQCQKSAQQKCKQRKWFMSFLNKVIQCFNGDISCSVFAIQRRSKHLRFIERRWLARPTECNVSVLDAKPHRWMLLPTMSKNFIRSMKWIAWRVSGQNNFLSKLINGHGNANFTERLPTKLDARLLCGHGIVYVFVSFIIDVWCPAYLYSRDRPSFFLLISVAIITAIIITEKTIFSSIYISTVHLISVVAHVVIGFSFSNSGKNPSLSYYFCKVI